MALALKRVRGQDLTFVITGGGTTTAIRDLKINVKQGSYEASAADALFDQKVMGRKSVDGSFSMWLGTEGVAPALGTTLTAVTASVGADAVTPTLTDAALYGNLKVTGFTQSYQDTPAFIDVTFEGGFI